MPETPIAESTFERAADSNPLLRWREYLHVLHERRWVAITTFMVVVVTATIWNARQTPMYSASARLQVDMSADRILNIPDVFASGTPGYMFGQYINTMVKALRSRTFIEQVVQSLRASHAPDVRALLQRSPDLVGTILGGISVSPVENSLLIDIRVQHPDREMTALLANAVAEQFIQQDLHRRMESSMAAVQWLMKQSEDQRLKVAASELVIQEYLEKTGLVSLEQRQDIVIAKLKTVSESLTQAETERTVAQTQWQEVKALSAQGEDLAVIPSIAADPLVVAAKQKIADLDTELDALKLRYKGKHPTLIKGVAALDEARETYTKVCLDAKGRIERKYNLAQANADGLREALNKQEQQALALSRVMVEYNELKRNAEADLQIYQSILSRMKETDLAGKLETTNIRLNDRAHVPSTPFKPRKIYNISRAAGVGLILGVVLVLVVHQMDDRVRRVEDFELSLGIPVLGIIPRVELATSVDRASVSINDPESQAAEAFRGLRASLLLDAMGRDARIVMVVSAGAAEGKSLISSNLAATFAQNGQRTLLMDADLRRPSIHKLFDIRDHKGLPHLLMKEVSWEQAVAETPQPGLDVLTASGAPSSPERLLSAPAMKQVLDEAREKYDRVIVDCPPLFGVSDPLLLLSHMDGVLFVALYNRTHRRAITEASQKLLDGETPILGAVINGMDAASHSYYYHRYGYKNYYGRRSAAGNQG